MNERWIWAENLPLFAEMVKKERGYVHVYDSAQLEEGELIVHVEYDRCNTIEYESRRIKKN